MGEDKSGDLFVIALLKVEGLKGLNNNCSLKHFRFGMIVTSDWMLLWDMSSLTVWRGSTGNWARPEPEQLTETVKEKAGAGGSE